MKLYDDDDFFSETERNEEYAIKPKRTGAESRTGESKRTGAESRTGESKRTGAESRTGESKRTGAESRTGESKRTGAESWLGESKRTGAESRSGESKRTGAENQLVDAERGRNKDRARDRERDRKRKRRESRKKGRAGLIVLIFLLLIVIGLLGYKIYLQKTTLDLVEGDHSEQIDISREVAAGAEGWFESIEGVTVTTDDLAAAIGPLEITVTTHCELDMYDKLTTTREIDMDSYEECKTKAYQGLEHYYISLIEIRLGAAGVTPDENQSVDDLIREVTGMSAEEYVKKYAPDFFPTYEELNGEYAELLN